VFVGSVAERVKAPFLRQPCDHDHVRDLGSTPTLIGHVVAFLDKALYDDYLSSKFSGKKSKKQPENSEMDNSKAGADLSKIYRHRRFLVTGG